MRRIIRILVATIAMCVALAFFSIACGGGSGSGSTSTSASHVSIFNSNPLGLHLRSVSQAARASIGSAFVANAQGATSTVTSNLTGWCASFGVGGIPQGARAAASFFALGRFTDGNCDDRSLADSSSGVVIPSNGQIGNLVCDAVGTGIASDSGQTQVKIIHADGSETVTPLTCAFGVSSSGKVHSEDKTTADRVNVLAGDQVAARFFINGPTAPGGTGDSYTVIRVSIDYATPNF